MSEIKSVYEMQLHEIITSPESSNSHLFFTTIMRVPGGWIYRSIDKGNGIFMSVFVPYHNEFQS